MGQHGAFRIARGARGKLDINGFIELQFTGDLLQLLQLLFARRAQQILKPVDAGMLLVINFNHMF